MNKVKTFFKKIIPSRRKIIQLYAFLLYNANVKGFISGSIFKGDSKGVCVPGMNCYSCPGAIGACPLGSLQNALSESKTRTPTYVLGIILLYCLMLGRTICGFLCPAGLFQELLYKIKTPKLKKNEFTRILSYLKYVILVVLVICIPLIYGLQSQAVPLPAFCKYICPVGTFEGAVMLLINPANFSYYNMLGYLFSWKFALLIVFIVASIFIFRFFCRFFCPLGALYGLFNKFSIIGIKVDDSKCDSCGACVNHCKMDVKKVGDHECINCGECRSVCHNGAIYWKNIVKEIRSKGAEGAPEAITATQEVVEETEEESEVSSPKKKVNKALITKITCGVVALGVLVGVFIYANSDRNEHNYKLNDTANFINLTLADGSDLLVSKNEEVKVLYFYDNFDDEKLNTLNHYAYSNVSIYAISSPSNAENNKQLASASSYTSLTFTYESDDTLIGMFNKDKTYPYYVCLNQKNVIFYSSNEMFNEEYYSNFILSLASGKTIGNEVGDICYDLDAPIIDGSTFSLFNNRGKVTVINFWGTWCTPCVQEMPIFAKLGEEYQEDVTVVAIHGGAGENNQTDCTKYVNKNWSDYKITFGYDDADSTLFNLLGGKDTYPFTMVIDQDGVVSFTCEGSVKENELFSLIDTLLNK